MPPDICFNGPAGGHIIPAPIEDTDGAGPVAERMRPHPAQVLPGQGLSERGGDLAPLPQLSFRRPGPAQHGQDQLLHVQDRGDQKGAVRRIEGQHGEISADAVRPERDALPAAAGPVQRRTDIRRRRPRGQLLAPVPALSMAGQVDGEDLISLGAGCPGEGLRLFFMAHLAMQEQISPVRGLSI